MIKEAQRIHKKCMNVINQDAMDDKIKERCKTCEKQCMQKDLNWSRGVEMLLSQPRWIESCQEAIEGTKSFSIDRPSYWEVLRLR